MDIFERSSKSILFQVKYQHLKCASKDCKSQSFKVVVFFRNYGIRKNKIKDTPILKPERSKLLQNPKELQGTSKAIRNGEWLKLKRVTWQKKSFFLKKRLLFCQASFFKFGRLSYVMALISSRKKMEDEEDQKTLFSVLRSWKIPFLIRSQNCIAFWLSNLYFKSWTDSFTHKKIFLL